MHRSEAQDAILKPSQHETRIFRLSPPDLHVHDRRHQLKIVLNSVVDLFQKNILVTKAVFQCGFIADNRLRHADKCRLYVHQLARDPLPQDIARHLPVVGKVAHLPPEFANVAHRQTV